MSPGRANGRPLEAAMLRQRSSGRRTRAQLAPRCVAFGESGEPTLAAVTAGVEVVDRRRRAFFVALVCFRRGYVSRSSRRAPGCYVGFAVGGPRARRCDVGIWIERGLGDARYSYDALCSGPYYSALALGC